MKRWQKILLSVACCVVVAVALTIIVGPAKVICRTIYMGLRVLGDSDAAAYMYALSIEDDFMKSETQADLERIVVPCSAAPKQIPPSASAWGGNYVLKDGERMVQYMIKDHAPLEVVYDHQNRVQAVFTSYE